MLPAPVQGELRVDHMAYSLSYSEQHEQARWVTYMLTRQRLDGDVPRCNNFAVDPDVPSGSATPADYKGSGYSRGHLVPAADMKWDATAMNECFYMSNMSPQLQEFNGGIWDKIERRVRAWARDYDTLYIVTGPVLADGLDKIGASGVSVPQYFYKVVYCPRLGEAVGFVVPHRKMKSTLPKLAVSVDEVEARTGIDFFADLPDDVENALEARCDTKQWNWK